MARRPRTNTTRRQPALPPIPDDLGDQSLTASGLPAPRHEPGRVLLIACGALAREILHIKTLGGWDHMDLTCLPAILHNHPDRITAAVKAAILKHRDAYEQIHVVYADCGTGGQLQKTCDHLSVEMIKGPHCYSFLEGNDAFQQRDDITAFYLTDFLARQFDAFVWTPLGLDRHSDLRDMYFGHYTKLVYLAQTDDPVLTDKAMDCAKRLGLRFERRNAGYGDLQHRIAEWATRDP